MMGVGSTLSQGAETLADLIDPSADMTQQDRERVIELLLS